MIMEYKVRNIKNTILVLLLSLSMNSCGGGGVSSPTGPTGHTVSFSPTTPSVGSNYVKMEQTSVSGDTVIIAVKAVSIAEPVGGLAIDVTYDTSKLSFVSASNGGVVTGNTSSFIATDNSGTVVVSVTDVPDPAPSASGALFTITLKGISTGAGNVGISNHALFNAAGGAISGVTWTGGSVTVQ